jgi:thiazole/oxazole-forming peptide maturase SagD family component
MTDREGSTTREPGVTEDPIRRSGTISSPWPISTRHPRLVRIDIVAHPDGGVVVTTPQGKIFRVHLDEAELLTVVSACDGQTSFQDVVGDHARPDELRALLETLHAQGCLSSSTSKTGIKDWVRFGDAVSDPGRPSRTDLVVVGSGRLATTAAELLHSVFDKRFGSAQSVKSPAEPVLRDRTADTVMLVFADQFDHALLTAVDHDRRKDGGCWSYFCFDAQRGWFGPHGQPNHGPTFVDSYARRLAAAADPAAIRARETRAPTWDEYLPPDPELIWMLSAYLIDVERWLVGASALGLWHEVELNPIDMSITRRPVLPLPDSPPARLPRGLVSDPTDMLLDARLGIVTGLSTVASHPSVPGLTTIKAAGCDISRVRPWRNDPVGGGSSFGDAGPAKKAAVGELVERYCGNIVCPDLLTRATFNELVTAGEYAVDPDDLVLFSPRQYASPGFPFVPLTRDNSIHWVRGHSLTRDVAAWLPASLVYVNWYTTPWGASESPVNGTFFPGVAAGSTLRDSVASGLREVIERHATMVWWLNRQRLHAVQPTPELKAVWPRGVSDDRLRAWLIHIDNEFSVPVMAGVVEDVEESILTIGFAARATPEEAALKAWAEAVVLQEICRDLQSHNSAYGEAITLGRLPAQGLKPWRADRRYLDDYRADFRDVVTLICQSQLHLDPRAVDIVRPWVDVPADRSMRDLPQLTSGGLTALQAAVHTAGYEVFYADITTPDVAAAGLCVTRTVVPSTVANSPAAFPFLGGRTVQDSAVRLGWRHRPRPEEELTTIPLPHT